MTLRALSRYPGVGPTKYHSFVKERCRASPRRTGRSVRVKQLEHQLLKCPGAWDRYPEPHSVSQRIPSVLRASRRKDEGGRWDGDVDASK